MIDILQSGCKKYLTMIGDGFNEYLMPQFIGPKIILILVECIVLVCVIFEQEPFLGCCSCPNVPRAVLGFVFSIIRLQVTTSSIQLFVRFAPMLILGEHSVHDCQSMTCKDVRLNGQLMTTDYRLRSEMHMVLPFSTLEESFEYSKSDFIKISILIIGMHYAI